MSRETATDLFARRQPKRNDKKNNNNNHNSNTKSHDNLWFKIYDSPEKYV